MALVKGSDTLSTGLGVGSNLGQELKEQRERGQAVSEINKQLVESGTSFDPQTQAINVQGYQEQKRKYDNYVKELDNYNKNLAINGVEGAVEQIVPKVSISNGAVKFTGTEAALKSDVANKMREKLSVDLKGVDINSPDVALAVQSMTQETEKAIREQVVRDGLGWEPENYDRYKYAVQTMQSTTPMKSSNLIEARDKDGKIVKKTPQQWVDYWMNNYDSDQRRDMFLNGARVYKEGGDGLDAIPYVIMSAGMQSDNAVYGFNAGDAWRALVRGAGAEYAKLGQGIVNTTQDITQGLGSVKRRFSALGMEEPTDMIEIVSPQQFNNVISRLRSGGPSIVSENALSDEEKQILSLGSNGGTAWNRSAFGQDKALDISAIADGVDYQTYVSRANDLNHQIQQNASLKEFDEQVQKDADVYAEAATTAGRFAGIVGRFAAEALAVKGLTGVNIMGLGERVASKIWSSARGAEFADNAIPIAQTIGRAVVGATSSIPENVVQVAIDNVATGRLDTNSPFMTPEEVAQDTAMTFLVSLVLAGGKAIGSSALNRGVKQAAAEPEKRNIVIDADDLVRGTRQASEAVEENRVTRINDDGHLEYEGMNGETVVFDKAPAVEVFANTDNPRLQSAISDYIDDKRFKDFDYDEATENAGVQYDQYSDISWFYSPDRSPKDSTCGPITALEQYENNLVIFRTNGSSVYQIGSEFSAPAQEDMFSYNIGVERQEDVTNSNGNLFIYNRSEGLRRFSGAEATFQSAKIDNELRKIPADSPRFMLAHANKVRFYCDLPNQHYPDGKGYADHCFVYHTVLAQSSPWYLDDNTPICWAIGDQNSDTIYAMHANYPAIYIVDYPDKHSDFDSSINMEYHTPYKSPGSMNGWTILRRTILRIVASGTNAWYIGLDFDHRDKPAVWRKYVHLQEDEGVPAEAIFDANEEVGTKVITLMMRAKVRDYQVRVKVSTFNDPAMLQYISSEVGSTPAI